MVVGQLGTGKSTFLNHLIGKDYFKTGDIPTSCTRDFTYYEEGYRTFWDSPGLGDPDIITHTKW